MKILGFESFQIPLGASVIDMAGTFRAALVSCGWQIIGDGSAMSWNAVLTNFGQPSYAGANAFDEDTGIWAATTDALPRYLGLTFDAPRTVARFRIVSGHQPDQWPTAWDLQWSDDAGVPANWTTQQSYAYSRWNSNIPLMCEVANPTTHKHWRVLVTGKSTSSWVAVHEISFFDSNGNKSTKVSETYLDIMPPVTEAIGNQNGFAFVRMKFSGTAIKYAIIKKTLVAYPQVFLLRAKAGGMASNAVTIDGVTVTQDPETLAVGNTMWGNLLALFNALRASANPKISEWRFEWVETAGPTGGEASLIRATRKEYAADVVVIPNANVEFLSNGYSVPAGTLNDAGGRYDGYSSRSGGCGLEYTVDLIQGFVYYLGVYNRGFTIASKTNTGFFGPVTCEWADNEKANSALPTPLSRYVTPVELFIIGNGRPVGIGGGSYDYNKFRPSHFLALSDRHGVKDLTLDPFYNCSIHPFQRNKFRGMLYDAEVANNFGTVNNALAGSGIWSGGTTGDIGDDFQVHRLTLAATYVYNFNDATLIVPPVPLECHFMVAGGINNEQCLLVSDVKTVGVLQADMSLADVASITFPGASKLAPAGYVVIDPNGIAEIVQYAGQNGDTLTGCVRGRYGTPKRLHYSGDEVRQGLWFVKINDSAIFAGYTKPN